MDLGPITIKQVLDKDGDFSHLELHQYDNVIKLSMTMPSQNSQNQLFKWAVLKSVIDGLKLSSYEYLKEKLQ